MRCLVLFKNKRFRRAAKEGNVDRLQYFLLHGAGVNRPNRHGRTALHKASEAGRVEAVKFLLDEGSADWEIKDEELRDALLYAVQGHHNEALPLLLAKKHNDRSVGRALESCVLNENIEGVQLLLNGGGPNGTPPANPNSDANPLPPLLVAARQGSEDIALCLLHHGAFCDVRFGGRDAPLHYAIKNKLKNLIKGLLEHGADINMVGESGRTPLNLSMEHFPDCVPLLLEYKPSMDAADDFGDTPLHEAAAFHRIQQVTMLIKAGANVNAQNKEKQTPLLRAIQEGKEEGGSINIKKSMLATVQLLLQNNANPNVSARGGDNPLCSSLKDEYDSVAKALLEAGAKPNQMDRKNRTPLYLATDSHNTNMVKLLLDTYEADPNFESDATCDTPLCKAIRRGYKKIALSLLDAGANANRCDDKGNPPLALVLCTDKDVQTDVFYKLLECNADPNQKDSDKDTILYLAVRKGDVNLVKTLLREPYKVDPNIVVHARDTCLGRAIRQNKLKISHELLRAGANVNMRDKDKETPLTLLIQGEKCDYELLKVIIAQDADLNATGAEGLTPLCLAARHRSVGTVDLLLEEGADVNKKSKSGLRPIQVALKRVEYSIIKAILDESDIELDGMHLVLSAVRKKNLQLATMLVEAGADIDEANSKGKTPLCEALTQGCDDIAKMLLKEKADADKSDPRGRPLCLATKAKKMEMAKLLLRNGADVDGQSAGGTTPLGEAIGNGNLDMVQLFLRERADPNKPCQKNKRPLALAAEKNAWNIVESLLDKGASPDVKIGGPGATGSPSKSKSGPSKNKSSQPLIHLMCKQGRAGIVKKMVDADSNVVNSRDAKGLTPLQVAVKSEKSMPQIVLALLVGRPDVNCIFPCGNSLLLMAMKKKKTEIFEILLDERSIDVNFQRKSDLFSALHVACDTSDPKLVDLLLSRHASPGLCDAKGNTPLHHAIASKNTSVALILIRKICDGTVLEAKNGNGVNALHMAAGKYANKAICEALVNARVDVDACTSKRKCTPLHLACQGGNYSIAHYLVGDACADVNAENTAELTPLDLAAKGGHSKIVHLLMRENADYTVSLDDRYMSGY